MKCLKKDSMNRLFLSRTLLCRDVPFRTQNVKQNCSVWLHDFEDNAYTL